MFVVEINDILIRRYRICLYTVTTEKIKWDFLIICLHSFLTVWWVKTSVYTPTGISDFVGNSVQCHVYRQMTDIYHLADSSGLFKNSLQYETIALPYP